jgi:tripartite-type tricarboxylate transporter receptor subunit TctC
MKRLIAVFLALGCAVSASAPAADYPNRPIRLVVGQAPGGATDIVARVFTARWAEELGGSIVVDNRAGAGGIIGVEIVAHAPADGYTLLVATNGPIAISPHVMKKLPYEPLRDFAPVALFSQVPYVVVVHPSVKAQTLGEFIALARVQPGKINFGSSGQAGTPHLCGELLKNLTGIDIVHVPYRGAGPALNDLIPGRVDVMFNNIGAVMPLIQGGQLRALGVTSAKRARELPDVPTVSEAGVPGFDVSAWYALFVPAKTPAAVIQKLHADTVAALADPATKARLEQLGVGVIGSSPEELRTYLKAEMDKWGVIIKEAGIKGEG